MESTYQSLYRRFRPQRLSELRGQDHVATALLGALRSGRVAHAYLFSGPRGTGKTTTARILAKALNCSDPHDGEPCGECLSCTSVTSGTSLDVHELDAASNNGVEAMRDLVSRASLGSPGRWKVYIIDEVHMLSTAASNALLKTLEEPPGHVVFVLATTDPHRVLPTVRSRTQHFEFHLLGADVLGELLADVDRAAALGATQDVLEAAVRDGRGSARDALSALDQMVAAGQATPSRHLDERLLAALAARDVAGALSCVAAAEATGREPQRQASDLVENLRQCFLCLMAPELVSTPDVGRLGELAGTMGVPAVVRAMEVLGKAQVDMREAVDPTIVLEIALVRLLRPELDTSVEALTERLDRLERRVGTEGAVQGHVGDLPGSTSRGPRGPSVSPGAPAAPPQRPVMPRQGRQPGQTGQAGPVPSRPAMGPQRSAPLLGTEQGGPPAVTEQGTPPRRPETGSESAERRAGLPSRDELVTAWGDGLLASLPAKPRARFRHGRFLSVGDGVVRYALPDETMLSYCDPCKAEVEAFLSRHFGVAIRLELVVDSSPGALLESSSGLDSGGTGDALDAGSSGGGQELDDPLEEWVEEEPQEVPEGEEPVAVHRGPLATLLEIFPGAEEVDPDEGGGSGPLGRSR